MRNRITRLGMTAFGWTSGNCHVCASHKKCQLPEAHANGVRGILCVVVIYLVTLKIQRPKKY